MPSYKYDVPTKPVGQIPKSRHRTMRKVHFSIPAQEIQFVADVLGRLQWQAKNPTPKQITYLEHNLGELRKKVEALVKDRTHAAAVLNFWITTAKVAKDHDPASTNEMLSTMTPAAIKKFAKQVRKGRSFTY